MEGRMTGSCSLSRAAADPETEHSQIFDPKVLRAVCGDNPEIIKRLLGRFLQVLDRDVRDLETAVVQRNIVDLRHQTHLILGSALSVGARELAAALERVGIAARCKNWDAIIAEFHALGSAVSRLKAALPPA